MTALTDVQRDLVAAANEGRLTMSGHRFYINHELVDANTNWVAADLIVDGLLYLPDLSSPVKLRPVHATAKGLRLIGAEPAR